MGTQFFWSTVNRDDVLDVVRHSVTIKQCLQSFDLSVTNNNYAVFKRYALDNNIDLATELGTKVKYFKNRKISRLNKTEEQIVKDTFIDSDVYVSGTKLKQYMISYFGMKDMCQEEGCEQLPVWNGKPLTLQVDHIDGNRLNNDISNLRILCPHCHTQTDTYGSKNRVKRGRRYATCDCGNKMSTTVERCVSCHNKNTTVGNYPESAEIVVARIQETGNLQQVAEEIGVSHTSLRRWLRRRGVDAAAIQYTKRYRV